MKELWWKTWNILYSILFPYISVWKITKKIHPDHRLLQVSKTPIHFVDTYIAASVSLGQEGNLWHTEVKNSKPTAH